MSKWVEHTKVTLQSSQMLSALVMNNISDCKLWLRVKCTKIYLGEYIL